MYLSATLERGLLAVLKDFFELTKPRVVLLMLLTVLVGMLLADTRLPELTLVLSALAGIALCAAGAAALNHLLEIRIDQRMRRTERRPLASGKLSPLAALLFALGLIAVGSSLLLLLVNPLTAWLTLASVLGYALVYTVFLKHSTPQNIVIGGLSGAMPPALGWAAASNSLSGEALLLVLIIFIWTPPHFWALALHRQKDYANTSIPMLTNTHGAAYTRKQVFYYSLLLIPASLMPFVVALSGWLYLAVAVAAGGYFLYLAYRLVRERKGADYALFKYSISYLAIVFMALLLDHWL